MQLINFSDSPTMSTKMSADAKKDEFRKYLEKAGVLELLTKSLVSLYEEPEKPSSALDYLKASVGGSQSDKEVIAALRKEGEELRARLLEVEARNKLLQEQVKGLETKEPSLQEPMEDGGIVQVETPGSPRVAAEASEQKADDEPAASEDSTTIPGETSSEAAETPATSETASSAAETPAKSTPEVAAADSVTTASEEPATDTLADATEDSAMETEAAPSDKIAAASESGDS